MAAPKGRMDVNSFLQRQQQAATEPAAQEVWAEFEELYNKRLWHQLTVKLLAFVRRPDAGQQDLVGLYENFIADFESRLNALSLVEMVALIIEQMKDYEECLLFLKRMKEKVASHQDASILVSILMSRMKIAKGDLKGVKEILEEIGPIVDQQTGITPIHGRYFQLSSDYHQRMGNHCEYYREALRYLGCADLKEEPEALKNRAFTLSLAALLGESIFNFGELLQHPIIEHLKETNGWVIELLSAFNLGDLEKYEDLRTQWTTQPDLAAHEIQLRQKISLLCLMEMTFKTPNGVLSFQEIAAKTQLPIDEVELLVMKALSLELVKGTIDQVDQKVHLSWVQPRVLDKSQIASLRGKLDSWCRDVQSMEQLLEQKAQDIIG